MKNEDLRSDKKPVIQINPKTDALIIVDAMRAFCDGGGLPVNGGEDIMDGIVAISRKFDTIIVVKDWHPAGHGSFASTHGVDPFSTIQASYGDQTAWPDHAIAGTRDAELMPQIEAIMPRVKAVIHKGMDPDIDSYSGFYDNDRKTPTGLAGLLREIGIQRVFSCGLAYDYCVGFTAIDAMRHFDASLVIKDLTRAINAEIGNGETSVTQIEAEFIDKGVILVGSENIERA